MSVVVSDVVWADVVGLLRWADAGTRGAGQLESGTWWRLAAGCADLLRRLPGLSAEIGEPWSIPPATDGDGPTGRARVAVVADRLAWALRSPRGLGVDRPGATMRPDRRLLAGALAAVLGVVAALTLLPADRGWSWGSAATGLRWYLTGLDSTATTMQLIGNLGC